MCNCLNRNGDNWLNYLINSLDSKVPFYRKGNINDTLYSKHFIRPMDFELCYCRSERGIGITISPDPTTIADMTTSLSFIHAVQKCFTKTFITDYIYTFEATKLGNLHVHGFVNTDHKSPGNVKYEFSRTLSKFLNSKQAILCKWSGKIETVNYITKNNPSDLIIRKKYNLLDIYTKQNASR